MDEEMQKRIDKIDRVCRWIVGGFCIFLLILAISSCGKKPIYQYNNGILVPEATENNQYEEHKEIENY